MLSAYGISHPGLVRKGNEDGFICSETLQLYAVADGMGGHLAGEIASRLALETVESFIGGPREDQERASVEEGNPGEGANRLRTALQLANRRVFRSAESREDYSGMGTTMTAALVEEGRLAYAHVGDSRLYLLSQGGFSQMTRDDSWVATVLAHDPRITPAELARHPMRHVLTSVLGAREQVEVQFGEIVLEGEQLFLLCSDGLHGLVDDPAIERTLRSRESLEAMAAQLIHTALDRGGHDNITAVLIRHRTEP